MSYGLRNNVRSVGWNMTYGQTVVNGIGGVKYGVSRIWVAGVFRGVSSVIDQSSGGHPCACCLLIQSQWPGSG